MLANHSISAGTSARPWNWTAVRARSEFGSSSVSFNPNLSVVIDGGAYTDNIGGEGSELSAEAFRASQGGGGHGHGDDEEGHGHGVFERGLSLREVEIGLGAAVDPYFDRLAPRIARIP